MQGKRPIPAFASSTESLEHSTFFRYFLTINKACENKGMTMPDILTVREVASYLKLNEKTTYRLAAEGKIPGFRVGGAWRFRLSEIERWIEEQEKTHMKVAL
jgi:excisionase family DNA binding protein